MGKVIDLSESTIDYHTKNISESLAKGDIESAKKSIEFVDYANKAGAEERRKYAEQNKDLKDTNSELEKKANSDELTGLYNRRAYDNVLKENVEDKEHDASLIYFDVDHFKQFNDKNGHDAGDYVLKKIGKIMKKNFRRHTDIPCRYGGEEFAVILPETDRNAAYSAAEHFRKAIENEKWEYGGKDLGKVTVSVGVASVNDKDRVEDVFKRADKRLYAAKETGRNKVNMAA
jgi:diguanylate cyclase (GGDEF)-like protein